VKQLKGLLLVKRFYFSALLFCLSSPTFAQKAYTVGIVPQFDSRQIHNIWKPILAELEAKTQKRFELRGALSIPKFEQEFLSGAFDFAYMNPFHLLIANNQQGYQPLIRDYDKLLSGILVVNANNPINSPEQLKNKSIAFPSVNSLGASMLIRYDMLDKFKINIVPKYVLSHTSVYLNVAMGHAVAGGGVQRTFDSLPVEIQEKLRVIHHATKITPHPFVAHPRVPAAFQNQVKSILIAYSRTVKGKKLFAKVPMKKVGAANMEDYQQLSSMRLERFYQESQ